MRIPEISEAEFTGNIEKDDFCLRFGKPVLIRPEGSKPLVCMAWEYYERIQKRIRELQSDVLACEPEVDYWVYELKIRPEDELLLRKAADNQGMSLDDYIVSLFENALAHLEWEDAAEMKTSGRVQLVRYYPVRKRQTEDDASQANGL